jgi:excisionase family DNA binding protein
MRIYTTGEVSKICKVATTTVNKWFDSGRLEGFRVPGSRHRRIPQDSLIKFLRDHHVPLGPMEEVLGISVMVVTRDHQLVRGLKRKFVRDTGVHLTLSSSGFEAGIQAESVPPDCMIVDFEMGAAEARHMCQNLRRNPGLSHTAVIALVPDDQQLLAEAASVADETFGKPLDPALLAERTRRMVADRPVKTPKT